MTGAKTHYAANLIIGLLGLLVWAVVMRLLDGHWVSVAQALPMALWLGAFAIFIAYHRLHRLDLTPPWLMLIVGFMGLVVYLYWAGSESRPTSTLDWTAFALLVALPVGLLVMGFRRWQGGAREVGSK